MQPRAVFLIATAMFLLAGCVESVPQGKTLEAPTPTAYATDAAAVLSGLSLGEKPDGKRAVADLEKFVAAAPRRFDGLYDHAKARDWLEAQYKAAGLTVTRHDFTGPAQTPNGGQVKGQNILATLPGKDPDRILMFGGHYDGAFNGYGAAYDDGSGTLITLDLARAMAKYQWNHTLVFASWDQEEAGLVGSRAYVKDHSENLTNIVLFVNFDMTGINWPAKFLGAVDVSLKAGFGGEGDAEMVARWKAASTHLKYPADMVVATPGLTGAPSDHGPFLAAQVPAAWVRGAVIGNYPNYHNVDTVETMTADVGGKRADLEAGFNTVLQQVFHFAFVMDQMAPPGAP